MEILKIHKRNNALFLTIPRSMHKIFDGFTHVSVKEKNNEICYKPLENENE